MYEKRTGWVVNNCDMFFHLCSLPCLWCGGCYFANGKNGMSQKGICIILPRLAFQVSMRYRSN
jgi:hypothetical protein